MKSLILLLSVIFLLTVISCKKEKKPDTTVKNITFKQVTASGGLRMRATPDTKGTVIGLLPESTLVKFINETGESMTIAGKTGKWTQVEFNGKTGWVFGGFLAVGVDPGMMDVPDPKIDISTIMGKNISFDLKPDEQADGVNFTLHKNQSFKAECLLHGSGKSTITGSYSQQPDPTVWRFSIKGTAHIRYITDKEQLSTKTFNGATLIVDKKNGKLIGTLKDIPSCEAFTDRELVY